MRVIIVDFYPILASIAMFAIAVLGLDVLIGRGGFFVAGIAAQILISGLVFVVSATLFEAGFPMSIFLGTLAGMVVGLPLLSVSSAKSLLSAGLSLILLLVAKDLFSVLVPSGYGYVKVYPGLTEAAGVVLSLVGLIVAILLHHVMVGSKAFARAEAAVWGPSWYARFLGDAWPQRVMLLIIGSIFISAAGLWKLAINRTLLPAEPWLHLSLELILLYLVSRHATESKFLRRLKMPYSFALVGFALSYALVREWVIPRLIGLLRLQADSWPAVTPIALAVAAIYVSLREAAEMESKYREGVSLAVKTALPAVEVSGRQGSAALHVHCLSLPYVKKEVSAVFIDGRVNIIYGPNGSGKSTFLGCLVGFQRTQNGRAELRKPGQEIVEFGWEEFRATCPKYVAYIRQSSNLVPPHSPQWMAEILGAELDQPYESIISAELSGGTRRIIELLMALKQRRNHAGYAVILMDEPFAGLDHFNSQLLVGFLEREAQRGAIVILSDHRRASEALPSFKVPVEEWVLDDLGLRQANFETGDSQIAGLPTKELRYSDGRKKVRLLHISNAVVGYQKKRPLVVVRDFSVESGSVSLLRGGNGIGKSTFLNSIVGFGSTLSGDIEVRGKRLSGKLVPWVLRRSGVILVPQASVFFLRSLKVREHFKLVGADLNSNEAFLTRAGISPDSYYWTLSGGQQRWLSLSLALASSKAVSGSPLLLLDEPFAGLHRDLLPLALEGIAGLADLGAGVVIVDHELSAGVLPHGSQVWSMNRENGEEIASLKLDVI